ncbi:MAG: glycosyltransferase family 4 protein [Candidatus Thorarchaeota archaeon]|jgi:hypothetical protein
MMEKGHELLFIGGRPVARQNLSAFKETKYLPLGNDFQIALSPFPAKKWLKAIDRINPDAIHAHNIIVARILLGTNYPVVYDDHEYWSKQVFKYAERPLPRGLASRPIMYMIPLWERKVLKRYPTLTTTTNAASEHKRICQWVGVTRNFPMQLQVDGLNLQSERRGIVYTGSDFERRKFQPHRDMTNLKRFLKFDVINGLSHREMMEKLVLYKVGITPWHPHPWHPYSDANRNYEYLHAGLHVVVNRSIKSIFEDDPYVHEFEEYESIEALIQSLPDTDPRRIAAHARQTYLWDSQREVIEEAYQRAGV